MVWKTFCKRKIGKLDFQIGLSTFFQINPFQIENLYDLILEDLPENKNVVDAYCGIGTISLYISSKSKKVIGLEENSSSIRSAIGAAKANGIENVHFIKGKVLDTLQTALSENSDVVVLDPPREGLDTETKRILLNSKVSQILYVSCNPETLLRDAIELTKSFNTKKLLLWIYSSYKSFGKCFRFYKMILQKHILKVLAYFIFV